MIVYKLIDVYKYCIVLIYFHSIFFSIKIWNNLIDDSQFDFHICLIKLYFYTSREASVIQLFLVTEKRKKRPVAGCRCFKGMLYRKHLFRLLRDEQIIHQGMQRYFLGCRIML